MADKLIINTAATFIRTGMKKAEAWATVSQEVGNSESLCGLFSNCEVPR